MPSREWDLSEGALDPGKVESNHPKARRLHLQDAPDLRPPSFGVADRSVWTDMEPAFPRNEDASLARSIPQLKAFHMLGNF